MELRDDFEKEEIDGELLGHKVELPNCVNCEFSKGSICLKFNKPKTELEADGIDIFHCPYFQKKVDEKRDRILEIMGVTEHE